MALVGRGCVGVLGRSSRVLQRHRNAIQRQRIRRRANARRHLVSECTNDLTENMLRTTSLTNQPTKDKMPVDQAYAKPRTMRRTAALAAIAVAALAGRLGPTRLPRVARP